MLANVVLPFRSAGTLLSNISQREGIASSQAGRRASSDVFICKRSACSARPAAPGSCPDSRSTQATANEFSCPGVCGRRASSTSPRSCFPDPLLGCAATAEEPYHPPSQVPHDETRGSYAPRCHSIFDTARLDLVWYGSCDTGSQKCDYSARRWPKSACGSAQAATAVSA